MPVLLMNLDIQSSNDESICRDGGHFFSTIYILRRNPFKFFFSTRLKTLIVNRLDDNFYIWRQPFCSPI